MEWVAKWWIEWAFGIGGALFIAGGRYLLKVHKKQKSIEKGMLAVLRGQIIQLYNHYMEKEYIPIYAMENVHTLFDEYTTLGGNGTIPRLVSELDELPHSKPQ